MRQRRQDHWSLNLIPIAAVLILLFAVASIFFFPGHEPMHAPVTQPNSGGTTTVEKVVPGGETQ
jgi:hypothetical protein